MFLATCIANSPDAEGTDGDCLWSVCLDPAHRFHHVAFPGGRHFHQSNRRLIHRCLYGVPACAVRLLSRKFTYYILTSAGLGALSAVVDMTVSALFDLPSGPSIVAVQLTIFLLAILLPKSPVVNL